MFSQIKAEQNFHSVAKFMPRGGGGELWGAGGVKNFSVGICDGSPSTAPSSFVIAFDTAYGIYIFPFIMFLVSF